MSEKLRKLLEAFAIFAIFLLLYALTAQRGLSWQDSGEFQYRAIKGTYSWHLGIALSLPAYILSAQTLIKLFGSVYGATFLSSLSAAIALALLYLNILTFRKNRLPAIIAVLTLGFAHIFWSLSTITEVYTSSAAFLLLEVYLLTHLTRTNPSTKNFFFLTSALFLANGLHLSFHNFALLSLPVHFITLLILCKDEKRKIIPAIATATISEIIGALPYLSLALDHLLQSHSLIKTISSMLFGEFIGSVLCTAKPPIKLILVNFALDAISFATPLWIFAVKAITNKQTYTTEKLLYRTLLAITIIHFIFFVRYFVPDQATFILPTLSMLALWLGIGIPNYPPLLLLVPIQIIVPILLNIICHIAPIQEKIISLKRILPFRDEISYWLLPYKCHDTSPDTFVKYLQKTLPPQSAIYLDRTAATPVETSHARGDEIHFTYFSQLELENPDPEPWLNAGGFYIVSPDEGYIPNEWHSQYNFQKFGEIYRLERKEKAQ